MSKSKYWILMKMFLYLIKFGIFHAATCNIIVIKSIIYTTRLADLVRTRAQNNLDNCSWPWCEHYLGLDTALMVILFAYHASSLSGSHLGVLWDVFTVSWELGRVTLDGLHDRWGSKSGLKCKQCDRSMWDMAHYSQDSNSEKFRTLFSEQYCLSGWDLTLGRALLE